SPPSLPLPVAAPPPPPRTPSQRPPPHAAIPLPFSGLSQQSELLISVLFSQKHGGSAPNPRHSEAHITFFYSAGVARDFEFIVEEGSC
ncbi:hypothetical protein SDJN02_27901, partial [Cucurbita argyrosperma subsp. argyrosperma]